MSLQIQQLAEQALEYAEKNQSADIPRHWFRLYNEKFAELIVKECMDIARNVGNISEPDDFALDRCYEIEQRIQDRFGVEE
jgi:hypothetical protein